MDYQSAIESAINGRCLLFLGSGYSLGAQTIANKKILSTKSLAHELCQRVNVDVTDDLKDASDDYINELNDIDTVINDLIGFFKVNKVEKYHEIIASIPWRYVYTTNYDNVYETSCANVNKNCKCATLSSEIKTMPSNSNIVLHINGMIDYLNKSTLMNEFKLTNTSYTTSAFIDSYWFEKFIREMKNADAIFFIGYSMYDIDIQKVFNEHPQVKDKTFFILGSENTSRTIRKISMYGKLVENKSASDFSSDIESIKSIYTPENIPFILTSFIETSYDSYSHMSYDITNDDIFNLFILGEYDKDKIYFDLVVNNTERYFVRRKELYAVINIIDRNNEKNILIQSEFGNGKTLLIEGIKVLCAQNSINCYELIDSSEEASKELEYILKQTCKQVIIIDNYLHHKKFLKQIVNERPNNTYLILTERTVFNTINQERLFNVLRANPYTITIDKLDDDAVMSLIQIFELNAFWKELSGKSRIQKRRKLMNSYNSSMAHILLGALSSNDIKNRLSSIYDELQSNTLYKKIVVLVCIFCIIDIKTDLHRILDVLSARLENRIVFDTNPAIRQLFNNNTYDVSIKSSIFAKFILKEFCNSNYMVSLLINLYKYCSEKKLLEEWCTRVLYCLELFSTIQFILPDKDKLSSSKIYFDGIRELNNNSKNFHYWLQYAISRTVYGDFEHADMYFKTSYSLYEKSKTDPSQKHNMLDNHFSRFLMLRANDASCDDPNFFDNFKRADSIVQSQILDNTTAYYPYRVALLYQKFYKRYMKDMNADQRDFFIKKATKIYEHICSLTTEMQQNRYVHEAMASLKQIIP
jgi:hypothetical protein